MKLLLTKKIQMTNRLHKKMNMNLKKNIHPVNTVLADVVSKKPFKSCGCGK